MDLGQYLETHPYEACVGALSVLAFLLSVLTFVVNVRRQRRVDREQLASRISLWLEGDKLVINVGSDHAIYNIALYGKANLTAKKWYAFTRPNAFTHGSPPLEWIPGMATGQPLTGKRVISMAHLPPGCWQSDMGPATQRALHPVTMKMTFADGLGRAWKLRGGKLKRRFFWRKDIKWFPTNYAEVFQRTDASRLRSGF